MDGDVAGDDQQVNVRHRQLFFGNDGSRRMREKDGA